MRPTEKTYISLWVSVWWKTKDLFVYYESINRNLNRRLICECRCDERLKIRTHVKAKGLLFIFSVYLCFVYYELLKRELKTKPINECRCDERLKTCLLKLKLRNLHALFIYEAKLYTPRGGAGVSIFFPPSRFILDQRKGNKVQPTLDTAAMLFARHVLFVLVVRCSHHFLLNAMDAIPRLQVGCNSQWKSPWIRKKHGFSWNDVFFNINAATVQRHHEELLLGIRSFV